MGEPINPDAWRWYSKVVGGDRCPVVDTWWQTETGAIMITPLPGVTDLKAGSATRPFFGDTHLHTSFSMDAGAFGARLGPVDAYRFAKGEQVTAS